RVILITGGGGGIAGGIARAFAGEGAKLILTDLFPNGMEKTKSEIEKDFGCEVSAIVADGSKEDEVKRVIEQGVEH
ncbi:MAG: SDR family NAD(P)-dependent oxidoreductase, partial [Hydrogenoanaerobacterium sp.]